MNIGLSALADFVPARLVEPYNPITGGVAGNIGIGDLTRGKLLEPYNPLLSGLGCLVPSWGIQDVQPNSVIADAQSKGLAGCGCGGMSGGCGGLGCGGPRCGSGCSQSGMGDISTWIQSVPSNLANGDMTTWAIVGGVGIVALWFLFGSRPTGYRQARREAIAKVRAQYPTYAGRARRAASAF